MKILFLLVLLMPLSLSAQKTLTVEVENPGTLSALIDEDLKKGDELIINGIIDKSDMEIVEMMIEEGVSVIISSELLMGSDLDSNDLDEEISPLSSDRIEDLDIPLAKIIVGGIEIESDTEEEYWIHTIDGKLRDKKKIVGKKQIQLKKGIYIISNKKKSMKICID